MISNSVLKMTRMFPLEEYDWKFGKRSLGCLEGVDEGLVETTKLALRYSPVDFGITCGVRTLEEQKKLLESGATQTLKSRHLEGMAVDIVAYVDGEVSWKLPHYTIAAQAFAEASREVGEPIRWGAAWTHLLNVTDAKQANYEYVALRRKQGRVPFIDGPHFEIPIKE